MPKEVRAYWLLLLNELNCSFRILYSLRGIRGIALHIDTGFVTPLAPTYVILLLPYSRCSGVMDDLEMEISDALLALIMHAFLLVLLQFRAARRGGRDPGQTGPAPHHAFVGFSRSRQQRPDNLRVVVCSGGAGEFSRLGPLLSAYKNHPTKLHTNGNNSKA
jgi:hypothetical protein